MSVVRFKWGCASEEPCVQLSLLWSEPSLESGTTAILSHALSISSSHFLNVELVVVSHFHFAYSHCFPSKQFACLL